MRNSIIIFIGLSLLPCLLLAQIRQIQNDSFWELEFFVNTDPDNPKYNDAEGTPYLNEDFVQARINDIKETQFIRFNAVDHVIEAKQPGGKILGLSKSYAYRISILDGSKKVYETGYYTDEAGKKAWSFFEVIYKTDKYTLFLKERIRFVAGKPQKSSYDQPVPPKFVKGKDRYYVLGLQSEHQNLQLLPSKKKDFIQRFGNHSKAVEKMIKKDKLKIDNREDLIKILHFYFDQK